MCININHNLEHHGVQRPSGDDLEHDLDVVRQDPCGDLKQHERECGMR